MEFGYVRVSTKEQNPARQIKALTERGIPERNIYIDKASGKDFERSEWEILKRVVRKGDVLFVESLDRLGRNYKEIIKEWKELVNDYGVDIVICDMSLLDTRDKKDLTGVLISDIVLQLLSYVAEKERSYIRKRQAEGIAIAREQGKYRGKQAWVIDKNLFIGTYLRWKNGEIKGVEAMKILGWRRTFFYKIVKEYEQKTGRFKEDKIEQ